MGRSVLPPFFQSKNQGQRINLAGRQVVQDELKGVILYGIVVKVWISLAGYIQGAKTAWVWKIMRKFHGP